MCARAVVTLIAAVFIAAAGPAPALAAPPAGSPGQGNGKRDGGASADFNGDGRADLAIGEPGARSPTGAVAAGAVRVLYGGGGGLDTARQQAFGQGSGGVPDAAEPGDRFGAAVAGGDFNRDGFDDLAVGAPGEDLATAPDAGTVTVLYGGPGGLSAAGAATFQEAAGGAPESPEPRDSLGAALAVGDVNGDRRADLAAGVPGEDSRAGAVLVLYGAREGLTTAGSQLVGQGFPGVKGTAERGDLLGDAVALGDVNGDGHADLAAGVPSEDLASHHGAGGVTLLYGSDGGLSGAGDQFFTQNSAGVPGRAETGDVFGRSVAIADVDGDGDGDLVVGAPGENLGSRADAGGIHLLPASSAGATGRGSAFITQSSRGVPGASEEGDEFGRALLGTDVNGDRRADVVVGTPGEGFRRAGGAGAVTALFGSPSGLVPVHAQLVSQSTPGVPGGSEDGDAFGSALGSGDANGDGFSDVAIGVPDEGIHGAGFAGAVNLLPASAGGLSAVGSRQLFVGGGLTGTPAQGDLLGASLTAGD